MSVKRYDIGTFGGMSMESSKDGTYVSYDDYSVLEQQLAESNRALRAETTAHENTQMQLEKMAAENAGMKDFVKTCFRAAADSASLDGADVTLISEGNIPATQFKPVADLYGLTSPTGSETSFTFDAVEASDFIDCGWSCQGYVELERYQQACAGNSPVIGEGRIDEAI